MLYMIINDYLFYQKEYKKKYGDNTAILMQVGKFFELYSITDNIDNELYKIADFCNCTVSKKNKAIDEVGLHNPLMAGFPTYVIDKFKNIFLQNNYTIVIIEQVTEPPDIKREITEILSPGMNIDSLTKKSNHMMVIYYEKINNNYVVGISLIDISTGKTYIYEAGSVNDDKDFANNEIFRLIISYNPCELIILSNNTILEEDKIIIKKNININNNILFHFLWENYEFIDIIEKKKFQQEILNKVYKINSSLNIIVILNLELYNLSTIALCCLLQFAYNHNADLINDLQKPIILQNNKYLNLEYDSALQLNIISLNNNDKPLIDILNNCKTSFGSRLFKERLLNPILSKKELNKKYDDIDTMLENNLFKNIMKYLNKILDLERIKRKMIINKIHPYEWNGFNQSLLNILEILKLLNNDYLIGILNNIINQYDILDLDKAAKYNYNDIKGNIFKNNIYNNIDVLEDKLNDTYNLIHKIIHDISDIGSNDSKYDTICKIEYTDRDKHYIYITKKRFDNAKKINFKYMENFKIISTQQGYIKLTSDYLNNLSQNISDLQDELSKEVFEIYKQFISHFIDNYKNDIDTIINYIANIDISCCNAFNSYNFCYYRPKFFYNDLDNNQHSSCIKATDLRHPIIERINTKVKYIGNDIELSSNGILLYGINASGKSSLIKTIGINIIMAQSGMFVPSIDFNYEPYHNIFTRILGADNIYKGLSSFTVEMTELRNILLRSNKNSLVLGDEICNGTESISALAIVSSAIDKLIDNKCCFIFATHLHELTNLKNINFNIDNRFLYIFHLHIIIDNDIIYYDRTLKNGKGSNIYGIEVCKALDMPNDFLLNAEKIRKQIQGLDHFIINLNKSNYNNNIFMDKCPICGDNVVDTHHIDYQKNSDNGGFFKNYHKNIEHNLVGLCKNCHKKEHNNEISIKGFIDTSNGIKLDFTNNNSNINHHNDNNYDNNNNYEFTSDDISKLRNYILYSKYNEWYFRNNKNSKYKKNTNIKQILDKINKLFEIKLNIIPHELNISLLDINL